MNIAANSIERGIDENKALRNKSGLYPLQKEMKLLKRDTEQLKIRIDNVEKGMKEVNKYHRELQLQLEELNKDRCELQLQLDTLFQELRIKNPHSVKTVSLKMLKKNGTKAQRSFKF